MTVDPRERLNEPNGISQDVGPLGRGPSLKRNGTQRKRPDDEPEWTKVDLHDLLSGSAQTGCTRQPVAISDLYGDVRHAALNLRSTLYAPVSYASGGPKVTNRVVKRLTKDFGKLGIIHHTFIDRLYHTHAPGNESVGDQDSDGLINQLIRPTKGESLHREARYQRLVYTFLDQAESGSSSSVYFIVDEAQNMSESDIGDIRNLRHAISERGYSFVTFLICSAPTFLVTRK
ncbi:hypothetical protein PQR33_22740 [Paraburkholderia sediminicola]|uniref:hypothetical protein n=1 Tax=Paraburkholderia sediminicola TaxID=458836 RepID=UPI0038BAE63C